MLRVKGVSRSFSGLKAVDDVSLHVGSGEIRGLIGSNGAGKSTLLHLIYGRLSGDEGAIEFDNHDVSELSAGDRARLGMGLVFQIANIFDDLTVAQNLLLGTMPKGFGSTEPVDTAPVVRMLETIELDDVRDRQARHLSHGQKQWLEIGMVLLTQPRLLLLDEPTSGMTRSESARTAELLRGLQEAGTIESMLIVEHNIEFITLVSDRVTVMHRGSILAEGTISDVQEDEQVRAAFLGRLR